MCSPALRDLCDIHERLKEEHNGEAQFSWRPETNSPRSIHAAAQQVVVDHYLYEVLLPLATPFASQRAGPEVNQPNDGFLAAEGTAIEGSCLPFQKILALEWTRSIKAKCPDGGYISITAH